MDIIWELLGIFALSSVKFLFGPGVALLAGYNYFQTLLITSLGGIFGVVVFYYFGEFITKKIQLWMNSRNKNKKAKKAFTRKNKLIVKTKVTYGLIGLALLTPVLLSIPLGSIIAARFFRQNKSTLPILIVAVLFWSLVITSIGSMQF